MYTEDDFLTRRERVNESLLRQILSQSAECGTKGNTQNVPNARGGSSILERQIAPRRENNGAGNRKSWGLEGYPLAMMYAPIQEWRELYDNGTGFVRGTIFKELDFPFHGSERDDGRGMCKEGCGGRSNG